MRTSTPPTAISRVAVVCGDERAVFQPCHAGTRAIADAVAVALGQAEPLATILVRTQQGGDDNGGISR